jgi:DMSO/TMAO reductase YedYZ molybdopterin-dependent catalytic subunit
MDPSTKRGFLVGMLGGAIALGVSFLIRIAAGGVFLPELAAQALFSLTPGAIESKAVETLQSLAKYSAFTAAVGANVVVYGVLGALLFRTKSISEGSSRLERFVSYSLLPYLVLAAVGIALLFTTAIQSSPVSLPGLLVSMVPPQLAFGATLAYLKGDAKPTDLCQVVKPPKGTKFDRRRRLFIRAGVASAVGAAILVYGVGFLLRPSNTSTVQASPNALISQNVTANGNFYRVDVNIFPPSVDSSTWNLKVFGLVSTELNLNLAQLQQMAVVEQYNTLECVSNTIGGDLISTAQWTGVKLKDILNMAGVQSSADYVVFRAVDGYDVGIPLDTAMLDATLLAYEMNGSPLPTDHGSPLRAIVPGLYGMMNCKWIVSIEAVSGTYQGYWQVRGWENDAHYQTGSEIAIPGDAQVTQRFGINGSSNVSLGIVPVAGVAYAGNRGVSKVEISADGGNTWTTASLTDPLSDYTWIFWSAQWNPPATGNYQIMVRATDGTGTVQTATVSGPFPNGATGYHVVDISVLPPSTTTQSTT